MPADYLGIRGVPVNVDLQGRQVVSRHDSSGDSERVADHSRHDELLGEIRESFGDAIAVEAEKLLLEPGGNLLPVLSLVAHAEERHFSNRVGELPALANQRTDSHIQVDEVEET